MIEVFPSRTVALEIGPLMVRWYGIMYLLAFLAGMWLLPRLLKYRQLTLTPAVQESLFIQVFLGVLLGGRLGFVLFYEPAYFLAHPLEIFAVWQGGMSSHGGIVGVALLLLLWARRHGIDLLRIADVLVIPVAIGMIFGRFGNFINQELYGTVTQLPWGISIPGVEGLRHPTQFYAMAKDAVVALVTFLHLKKTSVISSYPAGRTAALFLMLYGVLRFIVEHFREQPYGFFTLLGSVSLSAGQLLTLPVIALGIVIWIWRKPR